MCKLGLVVETLGRTFRQVLNKPELESRTAEPKLEQQLRLKPLE